MSRRNGNKTKGNKKEISGNLVLEMDQFLKQYYGIKYEWKAKLTHRMARIFLIEKENICLKSLCIQDIKHEDCLKHKILYVKDKSGKIFPYVNPCYKLGELKKELFSKEEQEMKELIKKVELYEIRLKILNEQGYTYCPCTGEVILLTELEQNQKEEKENIISIEEWKEKVTDKLNRQTIAESRYEKVKQKIKKEKSFNRERRQSMKRG